MKEKINVVIVGNSIASEIVYGYISSDERYNIVAFTVDEEFISEVTKFDLPVVDIAVLENRFPCNNYQILLGIGYKNVNQNRTFFFHKMKQMGYQIVTYIHPSAVVSPTAKIGEGSFVLSNSVIEPYVIIKENVLIWSNCTIAHHSEVESHCWIASNSIISGQAKVKEYTFIGVGSTICNEVTIGAKNIIGAACMISKNTNSNEVFLARSAEKHRFDAENYSKYFLK